jgi:hypothetical protein
MHIEPIDPARRGDIAQPLQCWPNQCGATIPIIKKLERVRHDEPIRGDPRVQGRNLARNGLGVHLVLG